MSKLEDAFREAARREFAMVPPEDEIDYEFSPRFERRMRRLLHAQAHGYLNFVDTAAKRAACFVLIIVLLLGSVMAITPIRKRIIQFFVEAYEDFYEITFGEEESGDLYTEPEPMVRYTFAEMWDGYYETEFRESDARMWTDWSTSEGNRIILKQEIGIQDIVLDNNDFIPSDISYENLDLKYYTNHETSYFVWEQYGYIFTLTVYDDIPIDDILDMIVTLVPADF